MNYGRKTRRPFTLVLGGGGARGLAHIGVLKALEKFGSIPSLIVGTSIGSLIGAMYAQLHSADEVKNKFRIFLESDFYQQIGLEQFEDTDHNNPGSIWEKFSSHLRQRYFFSKSILGTGEFAQTKLRNSLSMLLEDKDIGDLPLHFAAVACDLSTGKEHIFSCGSIITAVMASSAVPGVVAPIAVDSQLFIDGAVSSTIPVPAARMLSNDCIIAVDVRRALSGFHNHRHGYEIIIRSGEITSYKLNDIHLKQADIVLEPRVSGYNWNGFHRFDRCIEAGEQSVEENIAEIEKKLIKRKFRFFGI